jgi:dipeptidyl aminopeptidase/acylaminoacyl peptidase
MLSFGSRGDRGRTQFRRIATVGLLLSCREAQIAGPPPSMEAAADVAPFSRYAKYVEAKISTKGTYVALVTLDEGRRELVFLNLKTRAFTFLLKDKQSMAGRFFWANDERVVVEMLDRDVGSLASPVRRGELYAVDANGGGGKLIFGYRAGEQQVGSHIRKAERDYASGSFLARLRNDDRHILITSESWKETGASLGDHGADVFRLDVYSGVKDFLTRSPALLDGKILTDENGQPRIAAGFDASLKPLVFYRDLNGRWDALPKPAALTEHDSPLAFASKDQLLYFEEPAPDGWTVNQVNVATGDRNIVEKTDLVPPESVVLDRESGRIVALEYDRDLPQYEFVDATHPICRMLDAVAAAFPQEHVHLTSRTLDDKQAIVHVFSDRDPGRFMVVDVNSNTAEPIAEARPWIRPEAMRETSAFHIDASDGFRIHGYLTVPMASPQEALPPLVVIPHGGPHGVRYYWGFNPEVQLLASKGFAVLQVNFRGSGGYGLPYQQAGYRQWGDRMIQDIVDATRFAVRKGFADPRRICIYGASYGGYAALQATVLAPDLYACAVSYAGLYDLTQVGGVDGLVESRMARGFFKTVVGEDEQALHRASPVYNADKIKVPVLLIHGERDPRIPVAQAKRMRYALIDSGNEPEWFLQPSEAHGFYDESTREQMYTRLVDFLQRHTKPAANPEPPK